MDPFGIQDDQKILLGIQEARKEARRGVLGLEYREITGAIIAAGVEVHRKLGPGFLEIVYENALCLELRRRKMSFSRQLGVPVLYRGTEVGFHRLDVFVDKRIVVELKAVKTLRDIHFVIVKSYMRAASVRHGLLLNFSKERLEVKRVGLLQDRPPHPSPDDFLPPPSAAPPGFLPGFLDS